MKKYNFLKKIIISIFIISTFLNFGITKINAATSLSASVTAVPGKITVTASGIKNGAKVSISLWDTDKSDPKKEGNLLEGKDAIIGGSGTKMTATTVFTGRNGSYYISANKKYIIETTSITGSDKATVYSYITVGKTTAVRFLEVKQQDYKSVTLRTTSQAKTGSTLTYILSGESKSRSTKITQASQEILIDGLKPKTDYTVSSIKIGDLTQEVDLSFRTIGKPVTQQTTFDIMVGPNKTSADITFGAATEKSKIIVELYDNQNKLLDTKILQRYDSSVTANNAVRFDNLEEGKTYTAKAKSSDGLTAEKTFTTLKTDTQYVKPDTVTDYYPLAPLPGVGEVVHTSANCDADGKNCTPGSGFGNYLNAMINLFIGLCAILAMIMIVMGGIEYMTSELVSSKEAGKEKIINAVFGLILALGAFAILNTINPDLLNTGLGTLPAANMKIDDNVPQTPVNGKYCKGKYVQNQPWPPSGITTDAENRAKLKAVGINIYNSPCKYVGQRNCTSVAGLDTTKVINLKNKCGSSCTILITGGTECWLHGGTNANTNHQIGKDVVDIDKKGLDNYLKTGTAKPTWGGGYTEITKDGFVLVKETNWYHFNKN